MVKQLIINMLSPAVARRDFEAFREVMLEYKQEKSQAGGVLGLSIQCHALRVQTEEQEDGEERPDLLGISGVAITSPVGAGPRRQ